MRRPAQTVIPRLRRHRAAFYRRGVANDSRYSFGMISCTLKRLLHVHLKCETRSSRIREAILSADEPNQKVEAVVSTEFQAFGTSSRYLNYLSPAVVHGTRLLLQQP